MLRRIQIVKLDTPRQVSASSVIGESVERFRVLGRGVHNPSFNHIVQVWSNGFHECSRYCGVDGPCRRAGKMLDPRGRETQDDLSFLLAAVPSVISAHREKPFVTGPPVAVGQQIVLEGVAFWAAFRVDVERLYDPHLTQLDSFSSVSRQHYIDTGEYLPFE